MAPSKAPVLTIPPFDPLRLQQACAAEEFVAFDLNGRLHWRTRPVEAVVGSVKGLGTSPRSFLVHPLTWVTSAAAVFGVIVGALLTLTQGFPLTVWESLLCGGAAGAGLGMIVYFTGLKTPRWVEIDVVHKQIQWGRREPQHHCEFSDVQRLVQRCIRAEETVRRRVRGRPRVVKVVEYRSRLEMDLVSRSRIVLLETDQWRATEQEAYLDLAPLAVALSSSLKTNWTWIGGPGSGSGMQGVLTPSRIFRARYLVPLALIVLALVIIWQRRFR